MSAGLDNQKFDGGCDCGKSRYQVTGSPMNVNCCHCRWCQRETGSAFVLNAMWEADRVKLVTEQPLEVTAWPTQSGKPQRAHRCATCKIVLWSLYGDNGDYIRFVRASTLQDADRFPPNVHIFTESKQPWLNLEGGAPQYRQYYKRSEVWPQEKQDRMKKVAEKIRNAQNAAVGGVPKTRGKTKL